MSDPYNRLESHFSMCKRENFASCSNLDQSQIVTDISIFLHGANEHSITEEYVKYGNYFDILSEVLQNTKNVHFVDGTLLKVNPQKEFEKLLNFLKIELSPLEWRFNDSKQFYCLYSPVKFCLDEHKGSHRVVISKSSRKYLDHYSLFKIGCYPIIEALIVDTFTGRALYGRLEKFLNFKVNNPQPTVV